MEPGLDFGKVIGLLLGLFAYYGFHVFLCGYQNPGASLAFGVQAFSNGLQVGHKLDIVGNKLAYFIDKKVQPESFIVFFNVFFDIVGKIFNGHFVAVFVFF